jgi:hypothetical protein
MVGTCRVVLFDPAFRLFGPRHCATVSICLAALCWLPHLKSDHPPTRSFGGNIDVELGHERVRMLE